MKRNNTSFQSLYSFCPLWIKSFRHTSPWHQMQFSWLIKKFGKYHRPLLLSFSTLWMYPFLRYRLIMTLYTSRFARLLSAYKSFLRGFNVRTYLWCTCFPWLVTWYLLALTTDLPRELFAISNLSCSSFDISSVSSTSITKSLLHGQKNLGGQA